MSLSSGHRPGKDLVVRKTGSVFVVVTALVVGGVFLMSNRPWGNAEPSAAAPGRSEFARDRSPIPFDGEQALRNLEAICKIGPRISGSEGMKKQQELLKKHFEDLGARVSYQRFSVRQVSQRRPVEMANMVVSWHPERQRRVILCSHYDTRPVADEEDDRRKWTQPFVSANDGGSGVALLMEFGRHMKEFKLQVGVDFVFFDGEEYVFEKGHDKYFYGSEHFADDYRSHKPKHRYIAAILLDMVGAKDALFWAEPNSFFHAGDLVKDVWKVAADLKSRRFISELGDFAVEDDHLALNKAGIPAIDIIDLAYMRGPHWHRLSDVPENCSAETLDEVARVLAVWLQRLK
jgi:hypothetical protein